MLNKLFDIAQLFGVIYLGVLGSLYILEAEAPATIREEPVALILLTYGGGLAIGLIGIGTINAFDQISAVSAFLISLILLTCQFGFLAVILQPSYNLMDGNVYAALAMLLASGFLVGTRLGSDHT